MAREEVAGGTLGLPFSVPPSAFSLRHLSSRFNQISPASTIQSSIHTSQMRPSCPECTMTVQDAVARSDAAIAYRMVIKEPVQN